jgi:hypothetical protein
MIKFGAQEIILDQQDDKAMAANIDSIIEYSLKKTEEINNQMKMIEDKFNLNSVSLTGEDERQQNSGLYTFEG